MTFIKTSISLLAFCCYASLLVFSQKNPIVAIGSANWGTTLAVDYTITNASDRDVYVFAPFLQEPFSAELKARRSRELVWATFDPSFKGNYFSRLEFIKIPVGQSYFGHISSDYAAQQMNNCTEARHLVVRLVIGWFFDTGEVEKQWKQDTSRAISLVQKSQSLAVSPDFVVERTQDRKTKECPQQQKMEIWQ